MAAALWALIGALAALGPGPAVAAAPRLPLLVWSTERSLWPPQSLPAGRALSEPELQELLEPGLRRGPRTVLLFLQEQLSLEDFTAFGAHGAFPRLQDALGSAGSALTVPAVAGAAAAALPLTLQRLLGAPPPLRLPGGALAGLRLNRTEPRSDHPSDHPSDHGTDPQSDTESDPQSDPQPSLLLVGLPHRRSGLMGAREALSRNDAVLGEVLRVLQEEQIPYTALLSAERPADPRPSPPPGFWGSPAGAAGPGGGGGAGRAPPPALAPPGGPQNSALGPEPVGDARGAPPGPHPKNLRGRRRGGSGGVLLEPPRGPAGSALPGGFWGAPEHHVPAAPGVVPGLGAPLGVAGGNRGDPGGGPPRPVPNSGRGRPLPPGLALRRFGDPRPPPAAPPPPGAEPALGDPDPRPAGSGVQRVRGRFWGGLGLRRVFWGGGVDGADFGGAPAGGAPAGGGGPAGAAPHGSLRRPPGTPPARAPGRVRDPKFWGGEIGNFGGKTQKIGGKNTKIWGKNDKNSL
nr:V-type proton ATPase subunit S1 isoform X1 [Taeniopygia guttata]XP_041567971.1 V-type proton ATPase subunit S1 isoform X2 [Taeniopygia guttata]